MADQEKKRRTIALRNFTRSTGTLRGLIQANPNPSAVVLPEAAKHWEKVTEHWDKLQSTHDDFLEKVDDIDLEKDKDGFPYLDAPTTTYNELLLSYSKYCSDAKTTEKLDMEKAEEDKRNADEAERKRIAEEEEAKRKVEEAERKRIEEDRQKTERENISREKKEQFLVEKKEFESTVDTFKRMNLSMKETLKDASESDKRFQLDKCTEQFSKLKETFIKLSGSLADDELEAFKASFVTEAETPFSDTEKWLLPDLKTIPKTSGGNAVSTSSSSKSTKTETVHLPFFHGDPKMSPFHKFPSWKEKWDSLIEEYPVRYHTTLLEKHLDEEARSKFIGWENNYAESMKRLQNYYGDKIKIVQYAMKEVKSAQFIADGDYQSLLVYSTTLESNYNRLCSLKIESEMSNTSRMT